MSDPTAVQQLQTEVAGSLFTELRRYPWAQGWSTVTAYYIEAAGGSSGYIVVRGTDGAELDQATPPDLDLFDPWRRLRAAMATPRDGAWLMSTLELTSTGSFRFTFEYDRRPFGDPPDDDFFAPQDSAVATPTDDEWRADFRRHPRAADRIPAWAAALLGEEPSAADPAALFSRELAARPGFPRSLRRLDRDEGWRTLHEAMSRHVREALLSGAWNRAADPDRRIKAAQLSGLSQEVFEVTMSADLFPKRAGFVLDLWSSWAAVVKRKAPAGFETIDRATPLDEELQGPLEDVGDDIADVLGELIAADLTDRFGVAPS